MAAIRFSDKQVGVLLQWKVKVGSQVNVGSVLAEYSLGPAAPPAGCAGAVCEGAARGPGRLKLKSAVTGTVRRLIASHGDTLRPEEVLAEVDPCTHPTVWRYMCAECGADLRDEKTLQASVAMEHSIPDLLVTQKDAQNLGREDEQRLHRTRKLVLLVDLDQTLVHTTNDDVPVNLKDVHHFQIVPGPGAARASWFHARLRPGTRSFLAAAARLFELHICTFGTRPYAHAIARILDPGATLFASRILSRDELFHPTLKTSNLKALFPCGDSMVCIIDDREDVWRFAPNMVPVRPYHFFAGTADINAPPEANKSGTPTPPGALRENVKRFVRPAGRASRIVRVRKVKDSESPGTEKKAPMAENVATEIVQASKRKLPVRRGGGRAVGGGEKKSAVAAEETPTTDEKILSEKYVGVALESEVTASESSKTMGKKEEAKKEGDENVVKTSDKAEEVKTNEDDGEWEELIEWEDNDDYLIHLIDILTRIHSAYYAVYDDLIVHSTGGATLNVAGESESTAALTAPIDGLCTLTDKCGSVDAGVDVLSNQIKPDTSLGLCGLTVGIFKDEKVECESGKIPGIGENLVESEASMTKSTPDQFESDGVKPVQESQPTLEQGISVAREPVEFSADNPESAKPNLAASSTVEPNPAANKTLTESMPHGAFSVADFLREIAEKDSSKSSTKIPVRRPRGAVAPGNQAIRQKPDLKVIVPYVARRVLRGVRVVFSGVTPLNLPPGGADAPTPLHRLAESLGAVVQQAFVPPTSAPNSSGGSAAAGGEGSGGSFELHTTHVVAAMLGTAKVKAALRYSTAAGRASPGAKSSREGSGRSQGSGHVHVVTPDWLRSCGERWERVDERLFPLNAESSRESVICRDSPEPRGVARGLGGARGGEGSRKGETRGESSQDGDGGMTFTLDDLSALQADFEGELSSSSSLSSSDDEHPSSGKSTGSKKYPPPAAKNGKGKGPPDGKRAKYKKYDVMKKIPGCDLTTDVLVSGTVAVVSEVKGLFGNDATPGGKGCEVKVSETKGHSGIKGHSEMEGQSGVKYTGYEEVVKEVGYDLTDERASDDADDEMEREAAEDREELEEELKEGTEEERAAEAVLRSKVLKRRLSRESESSSDENRWVLGGETSPHGWSDNPSKRTAESPGAKRQKIEVAGAVVVKGGESSSESGEAGGGLKFGKRGDWEAFADDISDSAAGEESEEWVEGERRD